ncbi:MAG TPA: lysyl oxidase family protein, partial [Verrucomicrobiae bacterium]|nr:lysyl oxidase family protein [Verrucomicrobiae bacterium]
MASANCRRRNKAPGKSSTTLIFGLTIFLLSMAGIARAQKAFIYDAWWTYQQDCNGDGCVAGTLPGDLARLNWEPDVTNCNGTLTVYEVVSMRPCGASDWTPIYTNAPHDIVGCRSTGQQYFDVPMGTDCACRDYMIAVYRLGRSNPDHIRSSTNDVDLAARHEQALASDYCLSDYFASCISLEGPSGTESDVNLNATKEPNEPDHAGNPGGKSLWFCWTPTNNTQVTFDTIGSTFDTLLAVYTGDSLSGLTLVASNDDIQGATNRQSQVAFTPVAGTTYHIAVDGFGGAGGIVTLNWNQATHALPNLILWGPAASPTVITRQFYPNDCEVLEGCETPGVHQLLSFTTETRNIGDGDLIMGNPATNHLFIWANCHQHYHFEQFAEYDLVDGSGNIVATGHKVGFCLSDVHAWGMPGAPTSVRYDCNNQGIQRGWADVYEAGLPCQYIDVTGVPPGDYTLQMIV